MSLADIETLDAVTPGTGGPQGAAPSEGALQTARWATRTLFAVLGMLGGVWGAHIPSVKAQYGLTEGMLALVLFAAAAGAVISLFFAGRLILSLIHI
jgi:hypothetical protein